MKQPIQGGLNDGAMTRSERRKQKRVIAWSLFAFVVSTCVAIWLWGSMSEGKSAQRAIEKLEEALREKDMEELEQLVYLPGKKIKKEQLDPLFAYLEKHPSGYDKIRRDLEKQRDDHVYIKGLTSTPPIFLMKLYEGQYVFEPALYTLYVQVDEKGVSIFVNGTNVHKTETEAFSGKVGTYLPGLYEVKAVKGDIQQTKHVSLFGGERIQIISFQLK
ncbi:hypothetical protein EDD69_10930 [Thermolongibacillus altinsuensis]|uniref:TcaA second domain-containing protein n=1 Tax=Thermolongibacillus altinsuensis TaxID=575256 RepID=A0A4R1QD26_9BACL|nr:hypothetical protein [Thermolongibacillus altinsuensis]TCL48400.1 hypothetical protein EDD69_10930 [Thermolongibacillus altinsuensis]GMB08032.1 hypothetical protein B1no1_07420 [Thermolongibacillus altinsuensis]